MADLPIGVCLPELQGYLPEDVPLTTIQGGKFDDCVTTHPSIDFHNWVHSTGDRGSRAIPMSRMVFSRVEPSLWELRPSGYSYSGPGRDGGFGFTAASFAS
jgi:hypothetical protein